MTAAEFKRLQAEWDRKLAASGFEDIEDRASGKLARRSDDLADAVLHARVSGTGDYYRRFSQYLHDAVFASRTDRRICELHADGVPARATAEQLGTMRAGQERRVWEKLREQRQLARDWHNTQPPEQRPRTLLEQHLDAEGFDAMRQPLVDNREGFRRHGGHQVPQEQG
jgi:hypothetical protein